MNRITNVKSAVRRKRDYASPLRDGRAEDTRRRILEGLVRIMGRGVAGLSVPAVAKEAGVSVPTVYRHFATKAELVAALGPYLGARTRLMEVPGSAESLSAIVHELFRRNQGLDAEVRAAMASELGNQVRREAMPRRLALIRKTLERYAHGLSATDLDRFTRVALILMSSPAVRAFKDYLGLEGTKAADDVAWALETIAAQRKRK